jgi:hypothetical protein
LEIVAAEPAGDADGFAVTNNPGTFSGFQVRDDSSMVSTPT